MKLSRLCILHIFFGTAYICFINLDLVHCEIDIEDNNSENEANEAPQEITDEHTFIALIDIIFTDGSKKTCTGSIIHDNVVITAAHCFIRENYDNPSQQSGSTSFIRKKLATAVPELTASFVVIGTKKMFDTGYEQYLPIERIATHPNFSGWTADLTLVFTFAAMTSDKPGTIIPIARDNTLTPVDSTLTVLSWGHSMDEPTYSYSKGPVFQTSHNHNGCESKEETTHQNDDLHKTIPEYASIEKGETKDDANALRALINGKKETPNQDGVKIEKYRMLKNEFRKQLHTIKQLIKNKGIKEEFTKSTTKPMSRYLIESDKEEKVEDLESAGYVTQKSHAKKTKNENRHKRYRHKRKHAKKITMSKRSNTEHLELQPYQSMYKNWRRQMGLQQNNLTVDLFSLVNVQKCKKMVEKSMPGILYGNGILCYTSERRLITINDSGAPVVHQGYLVAVTVGGVMNGNDIIAVGMKMSCFCSWIAANLPDGSAKLECCQNCCR